MGTDCSLSLGTRLVHLDRWHVFCRTDDGGSHADGMLETGRPWHWRLSGWQPSRGFDSGVSVPRAEALSRLEVMAETRRRGTFREEGQREYTLHWIAVAQQAIEHSAVEAVVFLDEHSSALHWRPIMAGILEDVLCLSENMTIAELMQILFQPSTSQLDDIAKRYEVIRPQRKEDGTIGLPVVPREWCVSMAIDSPWGPYFRTGDQRADTHTMQDEIRRYEEECCTSVER